MWPLCLLRPLLWCQVAGSPELYPIMVEMGSVPTLLACLSHENTDIAADTIELFSELTGSGRSERESASVGARRCGRWGVRKWQGDKRLWGNAEARADVGTTSLH